MATTKKAAPKTKPAATASAKHVTEQALAKPTASQVVQETVAKPGTNEIKLEANQRFDTPGGATNPSNPEGTTSRSVVVETVIGADNKQTTTKQPLDSTTPVAPVPQQVPGTIHTAVAGDLANAHQRQLKRELTSLDRMQEDEHLKKAEARNDNAKASNAFTITREATVDGSSTEPIVPTKDLEGPAHSAVKKTHLVLITQGQTGTNTLVRVDNGAEVAVIYPGIETEVSEGIHNALKDSDLVFTSKKK